MAPPGDLERWNRIHIELSQALLGAVTPNLRMVVLDKHGETWRITFFLERLSAEDAEEIEDVLTQFEAFQSGSLAYNAETVIGAGNIMWPKPPARVIFRRKES